MELEASRVTQELDEEAAQLVETLRLMLKSIRDDTLQRCESQFEAQRAEMERLSSRMEESLREAHSRLEQEKDAFEAVLDDARRLFEDQREKLRQVPEGSGQARSTTRRPGRWLLPVFSLALLSVLLVLWLGAGALKSGRSSPPEENVSIGIVENPQKQGESEWAEEARALLGQPGAASTLLELCEAKRTSIESSVCGRLRRAISVKGRALGEVASRALLQHELNRRRSEPMSTERNDEFPDFDRILTVDGMWGPQSGRALRAIAEKSPSCDLPSGDLALAENAAGLGACLLSEALELDPMACSTSWPLRIGCVLSARQVENLMERLSGTRKIVSSLSVGGCESVPESRKRLCYNYQNHNILCLQQLDAYLSIESSDLPDLTEVSEYELDNLLDFAHRIWGVSDSGDGGYRELVQELDRRILK